MAVLLGSSYIVKMIFTMNGVCMRRMVWKNNFKNMTFFVFDIFIFYERNKPLDAFGGSCLVRYVGKVANRKRELKWRRIECIEICNTRVMGTVC